MPTLRLIDEATPSIIEAMRRGLLEAPAEILHARLDLIHRLGSLADVVALQLDPDPAAGTDQFVARLQLTQRGADLVAALGAAK